MISERRISEEETEGLQFGGKSSTFETSFNFVNSLLGAGIIGIPLAIQQCGLLLGIASFALVAFFIYQSVTMMVACGIRNKVYNLEELAEVTLGSAGFYISTIAMFFFAGGGQTAYLVILGDTVPAVAHTFSDDNIFTNRTFVLLFLSTFIILPLCLSRELGHLAFTSLLSIILEVVLLCVIAFASFQERAEHSHSGFQPKDIRDINTSLFAGIGTMSFALVCQHNSFLLFQSLESPTMVKWRKVAAQSITFGFLICLAFGLVGFLAFYPEVEGDILNNFPVDSHSVSIARGVLAATMLFTYPVELYVSRHCLTTLLLRWRQRSSSSLQQQISSSASSQSHDGGDIEMHTEVRSMIHQGRVSSSGFQRLQQQEDAHAAPPVSSALTPASTPASPSLSSSQSIVDITVPHLQEPSSSRRHRQRQKYNQVQTMDEDDVDSDSSNNNNNSRKRSAINGTADLVRREVITTVAITTPDSVVNNPLWPTENTSAVPTKSSFSFDDNDADFEEIVFDEASKAAHDPHQQETGRAVANSSTPVVGRQPSTNDDAMLDDVHAPNVSTTAVAAISWYEHLLWTFLIWLVTLIIALSSRELGVISALTGTVAASTLGYTLPALIFFRCHLTQWNELLSLFRECCCMRSATSASDATASPSISPSISPSAVSTSTVMMRPIGRDLWEICHTELWPLVRLFVFPSLLLIFGVATFLIGVTTVLVNS